MSGHSRFAPSSADRWAVCQLSLLPYDGPSCRDSDDSLYARKGSACHKAAVYAIENKCEPGDLILDELEFHGMTFSVEMAETIQPYITAVNGLIAQGYTYALEERVSAPDIHEDCEGTADLVAYLEEQGHLLVGDLKTGYEDVSPDTYQIAIYAEGARQDLVNRGYEVKKITVAIVQPLDVGNVIKLKDYKPEELKKVVSLLKRATKGSAAKAGNHCKYCPHAATCTVLETYAEEALQGSEDPDPRIVHDLDGNRVATILNRQTAVGIWFKAVANYANQLITMGTDVPGWYLKDGLSDRFYIDKADAESQLRAVYGDDIYEPQEKKLRSPAQIEKIWPKAAPLIKTLTDRTPTGVKLKRKADD